MIFMKQVKSKTRQNHTMANHMAIDNVGNPDAYQIIR
jgi:hypothetical protein